MIRQLFASLALITVFIVNITSLRAQINDGGSIPLSFSQSGLTDNSIPTFLVPGIDLAVIAAEDEINDQLGYKAPRFGVLIPVDIGWEKGMWSTLNNGDRIWQLKIKATNARATNYYFDDFYMPPGAKMHIFNPDKSEVIGGFGSQNNSDHSMFSTALVYGDEAIIEYYEPVAVSGLGRIHISDVNHAYRMVDRPIRSTKRDFGDSDPCEVNVNCSPEGDGKTQQRDAVARILVRAGNNAGWCSGTMINNARQDCRPFFLTALHCADDGNGNIVTQNDFNQWVFYFNYQGAGCANPTQASVPNNTITGANVRADSQDPTISTGSDLLLLEFQNAVPANYNIFYAGWNRSPAATTGGFGIHHPAGDIKKISTFTGTTTTTGWNQNGVTHWSLSWSATANGHGVTEGGSSGSGLFDNNGLLIGSLSGGSSFCNNPTASDSYGKMSHHWDQNGAAAARRLKEWLDPDNTGIMTLAGTYFPCQGNNNLDAGISAIIYPANGTTICSSPFSPQVTLKNFGSTTLTSVTINYRINNNTPATLPWTGSLAQNATVNVMLPNLTAPGGNPFTLTVYTSNPNGGMDQLASNDTSSIMSQYNAPVSAPYAQNFGTGIPTEMQIVDGGNDGNMWVHNPTVNAFGTGNGIGSLAFDNYTNDTRSTTDLAYLPAMNLSTIQNSKLQFDVAYARFDNEFFDSLMIVISGDCRTTFQTIYKKGGTGLATAPDNNASIFVPTAAQWRTEMIDLSGFDGNSNVSIAFVNIGGWGQQLFVDNISVSGTVAEPYQNLTSLAKFNTLQQAINSAMPGETIQQISNAVETAPVELPLGYIFNFGPPFTFTINIP